MSVLKAEHLTLYYPGQKTATLKDINLSIPTASLTCVIGESGCGKTSLLNILANFQIANSGQVKIDDDILHKPDSRRAVVFQDYALFPWLTVAENVAFSLKLQHKKTTDIHNEVSQILALVGLSQVQDANIWTLSGGMKQRVAIARALISQAPFILLDEPFAALDAFTRESMQELVLKLWQTQHKAFFLISHDIEEALLLSEQLIVMNAHPGTVADILHLNFAQRYREGESIRTIKSDPLFIQYREQLFRYLATQKNARAEC